MSTPRFCVNCIHCSSLAMGPVCEAPELSPVDLVTGKRVHKLCHHHRLDRCGTVGVFFQEKKSRLFDDSSTS